MDYKKNISEQFRVPTMDITLDYRKNISEQLRNVPMIIHTLKNGHCLKECSAIDDHHHDSKELLVWTSCGLHQYHISCYVPLMLRVLLYNGVCDRDEFIKDEIIAKYCLIYKKIPIRTTIENNLDNNCMNNAYYSTILSNCLNVDGTICPICSSTNRWDKFARNLNREQLKVIRINSVQKVYATNWGNNRDNHESVKFLKEDFDYLKTVSKVHDVINIGGYKHVYLNKDKKWIHCEYDNNMRVLLPREMFDKWTTSTYNFSTYYFNESSCLEDYNDEKYESESE